MGCRDIANYPDQISSRAGEWALGQRREQGRWRCANMMGKLQPFIHVPYFFSDVLTSRMILGRCDGTTRSFNRGNMKQKAAQRLVA